MKHVWLISYFILNTYIFNSYSEDINVLKSLSTVLSESMSTKYARVLWQISFVYSVAENNDFYAAVCQSRP